MSSLEFRRRHRVVRQARGAVDAFTDRIESGEWLGLIGPNGAGKSSLLRAAVGTRRVHGRRSASTELPRVDAPTGDAPSSCRLRRPDVR